MFSKTLDITAHSLPVFIVTVGWDYYHEPIDYTMDEASSACRHSDVHTFDSFRSCLSCGEIITEATSLAISESPYRYEPLGYETEQCIQLVHVYPGQEQDDITYELVNVNLAAAPVYEAVLMPGRQQAAMIPSPKA
jgi:hypothetical protein